MSQEWKEFLIFIFFFVVAETKRNHICHNLGTGSKRGQLVTDLVSNGLVCDAWWTSPPATGLSVERREDKEKQGEECESLQEQTQDRSAVCRKPAGRRHCPGPRLSPRPCLTVRGLPRVSKSILCIRVWTFSSEWKHFHSVWTHQRAFCLSTFHWVTELCQHVFWK